MNLSPEGLYRPPELIDTPIVSDNPVRASDFLRQRHLRSDSPKRLIVGYPTSGCETTHLCLLFRRHHHYFVHHVLHTALDKQGYLGRKHRVRRRRSRPESPDMLGHGRDDSRMRDGVKRGSRFGIGKDNAGKSASINLSFGRENAASEAGYHFGIGFRAPRQNITGNLIRADR